MLKITTIPSDQEIYSIASRTPKYMYPSALPYAVVIEGALSPGQCEDIIQAGEQLEHYNFHGCDSLATREFPRPLPSVLTPLVAHIVNRNVVNFAYDLDMSSATAWMQTYAKGNSYDLHTDGSLGQTRKLTGVLMLSDENDYEGGDLVLRDVKHAFRAPRTRGTVVVFSPWVMHTVEPITAGLRHTINLGYYGPPFK